MTSVRPLLFVLTILLFTSSAFAVGDGPDSSASAASLQTQTADPAAFGQPAENQSASSDLFFLKTRPRLDLSAPAKRPRSAVLNDTDCYTMRMYKVKRKEHFADGENGLRGYSTCELASNYQVRSAVAHVQSAEENDSQSDTPQSRNSQAKSQPR
jgi:hypothetical protein